MRYIALLRGINVGGNNKVEMKRLKVAFLNNGFENVETYINSGNVIFDSNLKEKTTIATNVEVVIQNEFGLKVPVIVKTTEEFLKINNKIPDHWKNDLDRKSDVLFLWNDFDNKETLQYFSGSPEAETVIYVPGAILWNIDRKQYNNSSVRKFFGTKLYKNMTARNINTVRKLCELLTK